jgi:hypothetical protein
MDSLCPTGGMMISYLCVVTPVRLSTYFEVNGQGSEYSLAPRE